MLWILSNCFDIRITLVIINLICSITKIIAELDWIPLIINLKFIIKLKVIRKLKLNLKIIVKKFRI